MMELSKRLQAVADMVTPGMHLADVGTDHAYVPIYLLEQHVIPEAIAMDINKGPLERAEEHIREHGLEEMIQVRLSDGLKNLNVGEADAMITAGMGGALMIRILENGRDIVQSLKELILQPQSELEKVRTYLLEREYQIIEENMILEDGKYYPMMKVVPHSGKVNEYYEMAELKYGKWLLKNRNPILKQYLEKEYEVNSEICNNLRMQESERARSREQEIQKEMKEIESILEKYFR